MENKEGNIYNNKTNKQFAILSAAAIIMVISAHVNYSVNFFNEVYPYNSFFMPLFVFISGYFFKDENAKNVFKYTKKKVKGLLIYYFIWNLIYALITWGLYYLSSQRLSKPLEININTLLWRPFVDGQQWGLYTPAWFIPTLFTIEILFALIRKLQLKIKHNIEYISLVIFIILNIVTVYFAKNNMIIRNLLPIAKIGFFFVFFQLGKIYNCNLEKRENKISFLIVFFITAVINILMMSLYKDINFKSLYNLGNFGGRPVFLPIIVAVTGIWFWVRLSKLLVPILGENKILMNISNHTRDIMAHHIFGIYLVHLFLFIFRKQFNLQNFDANAFKNTYGWYRYYGGVSQVGLIYIIIGICFPFLILKLQNVVIKIGKNILTKLKNIKI